MAPGELKALRLSLGMSLTELAARTGLPSDYIEKIEEEEVVPIGSDLARIEKALKNPGGGTGFFVR